MTRWLHRTCDSRMTALLQSRDREESARLRCQKQYDDLLTAYQELVEHSMTRFQFPNVEHLFSEEETADDKKVFLTPAWEDREGSGEEA